jgi:hypothetical protein
MDKIIDNLCLQPTDIFINMDNEESPDNNPIKKEQIYDQQEYNKLNSILA